MKPYNELVKSIKFIELDDLCELIGIKPSCSAFLATINCENGSYVSIDCSDYYLEELYNLEAYNIYKYYDAEWLEKYNNEIKLIETLRETYGIRDIVLTYISW